MAYMLSANMDQGAIDFQLEAAISKVYASVGTMQTQRKSKVKGNLHSNVNNVYNVSHERKKAKEAFVSNVFIFQFSWTPPS